MTTYRVIDKASYESVKADYFPANKPLPVDIFIKDKSIIQPMFYKGTFFTEATRELLKEKGIEEVYIRKEDMENLHQVTLEGISRKNCADAAPWDKYALRKEQYCQICRNLLIPGTEINFSLFTQREGAFVPLIETDGNLPISTDEKVLGTDSDLMIRNADIPRYEDYLITLKSRGIPRADSAMVKALVVRESSKMVLKSLLDDPRSGEKIKEIEMLVREMTDSLLGNRNIMHHLLALKNYDYYTYTHSVNVAVLSIGLGAEIGLKHDRIETLAMGCMLHDLGKSFIPVAILNKPGKLTDEEFTLIKTHVPEGEKILRSHKGIHKDSLHAVTEHHERLSGAGYPLRLSGQQVSLFGRISGIMDVYDAITTQRCYQTPYTPFYALTFMMRQKGHYDPDLLKTFIQMLGKS